MSRRRIIRTSQYSTPSRRVVQRRADGKLSVRQKWLNGLGKRGMFEWEVSIKENGVIRTKTMRFDSIDDATTWAHNRCKPGQTYFVDGMEVISR